MKKVVLAGLLVIVMTFTGCSASWVNTLDAILAAAAPALINILQIVAIAKGVPVNAGLEAKVTADAATIKSLATQFAAASAVAQPDVCHQLQAAITTYSADQTQILQLAQVSDPAVQTKITLLSNLVAGTVQAVLAVIPNCQGPVLAKATPPLKLKAFVSDYNAVLTTKTGNAKVDSATPKMELHQHSKLVRVLSFGHLN